MSCANNFLAEFTLGDEAEKHNFIESSLKRDGGYMLLPEKPGLGIEIKKDIINQIPYEPLDLNGQVPFRDDGSIAFSV